MHAPQPPPRGPDDPRQHRGCLRELIRRRRRVVRRLQAAPYQRPLHPQADRRKRRRDLGVARPRRRMKRNHFGPLRGGRWLNALPGWDPRGTAPAPGDAERGHRAGLGAAPRRDRGEVAGRMDHRSDARRPRGCGPSRRVPRRSARSPQKLDAGASPLRERPDDIVPLARYFVGRLPQHHGGPLQLTTDAEERLRRYRWPGNVRELSNVIERAARLGARAEIGAEELELPRP